VLLNGWWQLNFMVSATFGFLKSVWNLWVRIGGLPLANNDFELNHCMADLVTGHQWVLLSVNLLIACFCITVLILVSFQFFLLGMFKSSKILPSFRQSCCIILLHLTLRGTCTHFMYTYLLDASWYFVN